MRRNLLIVALLVTVGLAPSAVASETERETDTVEKSARDGVPDAKKNEETDETQTPAKKGDKVVSGMSILGNQEAPKSLVIVPWKTSVLGDSLGIATMLDDSKQPVDREVFLRALSYYEIRSEKKP